jgi:hypothetical protein
MQKWQVCLTDEYGSTSIVNNADEVEEAKKIARTAVNDENVSNALAALEKKRHWDYFFVEPSDENVIYGGKDSKGQNCVFGTDASGPENMDSAEVRIYLGDLDGETWYAEDHRGEAILSVDHQLLADKSFYFIRKTGR